MKEAPPIAPPSCSLDEFELSEQLQRYRAHGAGAEILERGSRRRVLRIGDEVPDAVIEKLLAIERACCPFFEIDWNRLRLGALATI